LLHTLMTITENPPGSESTAPAYTAAASLPSGLAGVLGSGDHKVVGRTFIGAGIVLGLVSALAFALGLLGGTSGGGLFATDVNLRLFTGGQFGLVFGFALPVLIGFALLLVPLQVGAASVAFPRAAAMSLWVWLAGVITLGVAIAINGGIGGGNSRAVDLAMTALVMTIAGLLLASVCVATTVITLRAPGMTLDRVPMFSWSMLAATGVWLLTWPVLVGNLVLVRVDLVNGQLAFGSVAGQWSAIAWAFMQPQVFVLAIGVLGVIGDVVPAAAGRRQAGRAVIATAIGAFAALSIGSWTQLIQVEGVWTGPLFVIVSFAIVLPVIVAAGGWGSTLAQARPKPSVPLAASTVAMVLVLLAVVIGALFAIGPLDLQMLTALESGTPMVAVGVLGLVVAAVAVGTVAAASWWSSKVAGGAFPAPLGNLGLLAGLGGGLLWGLAMLVAGASVRFTALDGAVDAMVVVAVIGVALVAASVALTGLGLLGARGSSDADPWGSGQTLEWLTDSPPASGNFAEVPSVTSAEPLVDARGPGAGEPDAAQSEGGEA
jgi:heme/copper-type cytochrome/quinol oxidase subunit 1